ncbi:MULTISPECIES: low molecular weight protein arginine phosphatase [unclassified Sporosarcina]|uniref:low molecular weight protein arginine phosphatase n=1 Tax=unclassified Sporosarcina TaxID=2647733 RepID=UPI002041503D|nr:MULTISPECIES: low molecular weight protein arginine phosphatase [unclassified Sporosarcina]GKV66291.1 protein-tyrosine-phosphatase [Sporosarcina sp. NCCP-2331]GLB56328.1 protein-tyrosine-phosphatase [Sporosarcina sp. NCCP-2378]
MKIYFICTGNTCRSPLAEALLKNENLPGVEVRSAGIYAMDGQPISANSARLLTEAGISFDGFSNELTPADMQWAQLVLTMTAGHRDTLHRSFPDMKDKIFTLKEYAGASGGLDVHDPYGGDLATYRETYMELTELIQTIARQLSEGKQ